jgi:hypothetical protein
VLVWWLLRVLTKNAATALLFFEKVFWDSIIGVYALALTVKKQSAMCREVCLCVLSAKDVGF